MLFFVTRISMQKTNTAKDFYAFLGIKSRATRFSGATCLWIKVHAMPINFVSGQVTGVTSALWLTRRMARSIFHVILVCNLGLLLN